MKPILHSKIIGKGPPLLILHGYFGMGDNWKSLAKKFAENYEVHLIDQRNHGRSFHNKAFNYDLLSEDLYDYITHHKLLKIKLLGHSMGGKTAMLFAVKHTALLHKLVIVDIAPKRYPPHHQQILEALNAIDFSVQCSRKLIDEKLAEFIPELTLRQFLLKSIYWKEKGQLAFRFNLESLTKNNDKVGDALPEKTIFQGTTLFLKGEHSVYITQEDHFLIKVHFPNSKIVTIKKSGHWLHAENPTTFYQVVSHFLF